MKKKTLLLLLASILFTAVFAVSVSASPEGATAPSGSSTPSAKNLIKLLVETDIKNIEHYSQYDDPIGQFIQDGKDGTLERQDVTGSELATHIAVVIKDFYNTYNPTNKEFGRVGVLPVEDSSSNHTFSLKNIAVTRTVFPNRNSTDLDYIRGNLMITPLYILRDGTNRLHVICDVTNVTGGKLKFYGLGQVQLLSNGEIIAEGYSKLLEDPLIYSSLPLDKNFYGSNHIIDGYPSGGFIDIVFDPGTQSPNIDVANLNNIAIGFGEPFTEPA